ncbi:oxygenase MpaB family protein [Nonomuraea rhizosphaerae]|uniref:oxygenase MpaB family protein n=1 Tax=Nonomuraea rhizosphaerae TaxID=2665663 RepID=UPI001C5FA442|nr:oxygenase MpaB family protein [Nonomuraea rhizosphaerae]
MKATVTPGGGLFGPKSITWRIHTETFGWPAVLRSFQLQALHPRTIRGIAQNCLLDDPEVAYARLRRQLDFVTVRTFGSREQAGRAGERVRRVHARLIALDPDTGTLFRLDEQENLRWAHSAEVSSFLEIARLSGVPLTPAEQDAYVAEQRRCADLVGLRDAPEDVAELDACLESTRPFLAVTDEAREAVRRSVGPALSLRLAVLTPPLALGSLPAAGALAFATLPAWARSMYGSYALPAWIRPLYGLAGLPGRYGADATATAAEVACRALRAAATAMPGRLVAPEIRAARGLMRPAVEAPADVAA